MLIRIDENNENIRLDSFLSELYDGISRSKIQNSIKKGLVKVNQEIKKPSYIKRQH